MLQKSVNLIKPTRVGLDKRSAKQRMNKKARARLAVGRKSVVMVGVFSAFLVCASVVVIVWGQRNFGTFLLGARIAFLAVLSFCAFALVLYALLNTRKKKPNQPPQPTR